MEVYVCRKLSDDGFKDEYFSNVVSLSSYKSSDRITLHILESGDEGSVLFDVIKFEVY